MTMSNPSDDVRLMGVPYERPRYGDAPRSTPTYYLGGRVYVRCRFTTPRWGVTHFYQSWIPA